MNVWFFWIRLPESMFLILFKASLIACFGRSLLILVIDGVSSSSRRGFL